MIRKDSASPRGVIPTPRGHLALSGDSFGCPSWGGGYCYQRGRPGLLLNLLSAQNSPPTEDYPAQDVPSAEGRTPGDKRRNQWALFQESCFYLFIFIFIFTTCVLHGSGNET